jgi:hypothetical protein
MKRSILISLLLAIVVIGTGCANNALTKTTLVYKDDGVTLASKVTETDTAAYEMLITATVTQVRPLAEGLIDKIAPLLKDKETSPEDVQKKIDVYLAGIERILGVLKPFTVPAAPQ